MQDRQKSLRSLSAFAKLIGLRLVDVKDGWSLCELDIAERIYNENLTVHGGAIYSLADVGMGAAVHSRMSRDERCTTVEIKINYFHAPTSGLLSCETRVVHKGRKIGVMESEIRNEGRPVAKAIGTFYISKRSEDGASGGVLPRDET